MALANAARASLLPEEFYHSARLSPAAVPLAVPRGIPGWWYLSFHDEAELSQHGEDPGWDHESKFGAGTSAGGDTSVEEYSPLAPR